MTTLAALLMLSTALAVTPWLCCLFAAIDGGRFTRDARPGVVRK